MPLSLRLSLSAAMVFLAMLLSAQEVSVGSGQPKNQSAPEPQLGTLDDGVYQNRFFGFRYKAAYGWVDRTDLMREGASDPHKSLVLLALFERPPGTMAESVNRAVMIAGESASVYPGMKTAAEYFGPLTDVATGKGFQLVHPPYYFEVGSKRLVRADFSKKTEKATMYQSSMAILAKGYFVSFTFLGGSEDEVDELIEELSFTGQTRKTPSRQK